MNFNNRTFRRFWRLPVARIAPIFALFSTFLMSGPPAAARTVELTGWMCSTLGFTQRIVAHVSRGVTSLTVNVPVAVDADGYGWQQTLPDVVVKSSVKPTVTQQTTDSFGNRFRVLTYTNPPAGDIVITMSLSQVRISSNLETALPCTPLPLEVDPSVKAYLSPSDEVQSGDPEIKQMAASIVDGAADEATAAQRLAAWMFQNLTYSSGTYIPTIDAKWTLEHRLGQCGGWANLFVALARASGIPARVASGYTLGGQLTYPISSNRFDSITVTSFNRPHSWVEIWFPGGGWVPYEPQSSAAFVDSHHLRFRVAPTAEATKPLLEWTCPADVDSNVTFDETTNASDLSDEVSVDYAGDDTKTDDHILLARSLP